MKKANCTMQASTRCLIAPAILATLVVIYAPVYAARTKLNSTRPIFEASFRYAIIYNDPPVGNSGRNLFILMEPSEFSEANLRILFGLLGRRFSNMPRYTAYIETSLEDILTPEEHEGIGYSELPGNPKTLRSPAATIRHSPEADSLYIYLPSRANGVRPPRIDLRLSPENH